MKRIFPGGIIKWRDDNLADEGGVLPIMLDRYRKWIHHFASRFDEIPFGYTEWTVTGQLAIAADKLGYYSLQEYWINDNGEEHGASGKCRPDLYVADTIHDHDYVFEVKQVGIALDRKDIESTFGGPLRLARNKLYRYNGEAEYRCSLIVAPIWLSTCKFKDTYPGNVSYMGLGDNVRVGLEATLRKLPSSTVNFCGGFMASYQEATKAHEKAIEQREESFAAGVAFGGKLKRRRPNGQ